MRVAAVGARHRLRRARILIVGNFRRRRDRLHGRRAVPARAARGRDGDASSSRRPRRRCTSSAALPGVRRRRALPRRAGAPALRAPHATAPRSTGIAARRRAAPRRSTRELRPVAVPPDGVRAHRARSAEHPRRAAGRHARRSRCSRAAPRRCEVPVAGVVDEPSSASSAYMEPRRAQRGCCARATRSPAPTCAVRPAQRERRCYARLQATARACSAIVASATAIQQLRRDRSARSCCSSRSIADAASPASIALRRRLQQRAHRAVGARPRAREPARARLHPRRDRLHPARRAGAADAGGDPARLRGRHRAGRRPGAGVRRPTSTGCR